MPNKPPTNNARRQTERRRAQDRWRGSARQRGYTAAWDRESQAHLRDNPLCVRCKAKGKTRAAKVVDHIKPVRYFPELVMEPSNWQSLCVACNAEKAIEDEKLYGPS